MFYSKIFKPFVSVVLCLLVVVFSTTTRAQGAGMGGGMGAGDPGGMGAGMGGGDPHATTGELNAAIDALQAQIDALEAGASEPVDVTVNCATDSISDVLDEYAESSAALTITIEGTCQEQVTIDRDDVTLIGHSSGGGIAGPVGTPRTIVVSNGTSRVIIQNLTLSGGSRSNLVCATGSTVRVIDTTIIGLTSGNGISARKGCSIIILNSLIEGAGIGIVVSFSSNATLGGTTLKDNNEIGMLVKQGSDAQLVANAGNPTRITNNGFGTNGSGIFVTGSSALEIGNATVDLNVGSGITISSSSSIRVHPDTSILTVNNNGGAGIAFQANSSGVFLSNQVHVDNNAVNQNILCRDGTFAVVGSITGPGGTLGSYDTINCPAM